MIKEKPLFNAVSNLRSPLPIIDNPVLSGIASIIIAAGMGGFAVMFVGLGHGGDEPLTMYNMVRLGALIAMAVGLLTFISIVISAFGAPEEARHRLLFSFGGILGIILLTGFDLLTFEPLFRDWLNQFDSLQSPAGFN